ncbi:MAG: c-type cytochrome, partial [SAR324 cluster bacterium]|nr:c-type cytochrome [SAR324 cluster bacterium]
MRYLFIGLLGWLMLGLPEISCAEQKEHSKGRAVYEDNCAHCHGYEGDGQGYAFENVFPKPRDFTYGMFKIRTTPTGEEPT